jgi:predicted Fe-Mo cluster-binding NifX family protein
MKIAFVTDDGVTISQHFGRARYYEILTVEDGKVVSREQRDKMGHTQFASQEHGDHHSSSSAQETRHGYGPDADDRHSRMATAIGDCQYLVVGGMGAGAYEAMKRSGIQPLVTDLEKIDDALTAHLNGTLKDHTEYLH